MAAARGYGCLVPKRAVGDPAYSGDVFAAQQPEVIAAIVSRLEDKILAVGGPRAAAIRGRVAPPGQNGPRRMAAGGKFPERHGVGDGVDDGEAKQPAIGGPA